VGEPRRPSDTIHATAGRVEVRLDESPTTGYRWQPVEVPPGVEVVGARFHDPSGPTVAGGSGTRIFQLLVPEPGSYSLTFHLRREWEPEPIEVSTIELEIDG
jgi:predicted secreted protein